jgi:hypothetical protein
MASKILLSFNSNELKEEIVRFYFSDGGFFGGYNSINVVKNNNKIKYTYEHTLKQISIEYDFQKEKWDEFIDKIFDMEIHKWKSKYYDNDIDDGEQWNLEMEFCDLPKFESYGSNEYPKNWDAFQTIIWDYFPQMR